MDGRMDGWMDGWVKKLSCRTHRNCYINIARQCADAR